MSDIMRPIPFSQLMNWIIEEHKTQGAVFGVRKMVTTNQEGALPIFDERIETPFGPAQYAVGPEHRGILRGRFPLL